LIKCHMGDGFLELPGCTAYWLGDRPGADPKHALPVAGFPS
jgi:hypothetical protein